MIKSNSFTRLQYYQNCPLAAKFKYVDKTPELPRPGPVNGEHANDRGSRIHQAADDYVNGRCNHLIEELHKFRTQLNWAKEVNPELRLTEQLWTCDENWQTTDATTDLQPYLRVIIDLFVFDNDDRTSARIIDFKTGKIYGNEVKHAAQLQLYSVAAFARYPDLQEVSAELWYVDHGKDKVLSYTREQGERFRDYWTRRMAEMCSDTEFKPKPHSKTCHFCAYGPTESSNKWVNKTGDCQFGV